MHHACRHSVFATYTLGFKSMGKRLAIILIVSFISSCQNIDEFSYPTIEMQKRLTEYLADGDAKPVIQWATKYHGEAPGSQLMYDFVEWGNKNPTAMSKLLKSWPPKERKSIKERLEWAASDSVQQRKFKFPW